jgi:hypothetical protein
MTRRKDTLRKRNLQVKTSYQNRNSRIERYKQEEKLYHTEKLQEKQLVLKIEHLPDELIRLIYEFTTGKAKLYFNPKYARLSKQFHSDKFQTDLISVFKKMSKIQIRDLIFTGTLLKYPEIVEDLSYEYYADVRIRSTLTMFIKDYIWNALYSFQNYRTNDLYSKKEVDYINYRNLFVKIEKAYYLYKVVMQFIDKAIVEEVPMITIIQTTDPFSNELLIPTPLYPII